MIFEEVQIKDFMAINKAQLSLNARGLVTVAGENTVNSSADSNGSGKSTIGAAICWCLFNKTDRGVSGDDVIRNGSKEAVVSVVLREGNDTYTITRSRKKGKGTTSVLLSNDKGEVDLTRGTEALTQSVIVGIIGSTHEVFCAAVYMQQDNLICLPEMNDRGLKELVEQAAGLTELAEAFVVAKDALKEKTLAAIEAENELTYANHTLTTLKSALEAAQQNYEYRKAKRAEVEQEFLKEKEAHKSTLESALARQAKLPPLSKLNAARELLQGKLTAIKEETSVVSKANADFASKKAEIKALMQRVKEMNAREEKCGRDLSAVNERIGTHCNECGSVITSDHIKDVKASLEKQKEEYAAAAQEFKAQATSLYSEAVAEREKFPKEAPDATELLTKIAKVDRAILEHDDLSKKIKQLEHKIADIFLYNDEPSDTKGLEKSIAEAEDKVEALKSKHAAAVKEQARTKAIVSVFDVSGVRAQVLDNITPFLNERSAEYLAVLTDGTFSVEWTTLTRKKDGSIKEKFLIDVKHLETGKGFKSCSGGEKRRVSLACALALQDLVSARASKPINLLIADEIDDALDVSGLERLMSVMQEKAKAKGTILVISHNDLKSWIGNSITVVKRKGGSVVGED